MLATWPCDGSEITETKPGLCSYDLPPHVTYHVSPSGSDANDGRTAGAAFQTIQKAVDLVHPGDVVLVHKGLYHEGFHFAGNGREDAWIEIIAEPGAELRGSHLVNDWVLEDPKTGIYSTPRPKLRPDRQTPDTDLCNRMEQVFVDDHLLLQVPIRDMLKPKGVFYADDKAGKLFVCLEKGEHPNARRTEVSDRTSMIVIGDPINVNTRDDEALGLKYRTSYLRICGFTIRNVATYAFYGAIQVLGLCEHVRIENCDVRYSNSRGICIMGVASLDQRQKRMFSHLPTDIVVRHCVASKNGLSGMGGGPANHCTFEYNILDDNNYKGFSVWYDGGPLKFCSGTGITDIVYRGNLARNNDNQGLWFDYGGENGLIENNLVFNSISCGILNEVTPGPARVYDETGRYRLIIPTAAELREHPAQGTIIRNNILLATRTPHGCGIASGCTDGRIYNNITAFNEGHGIGIGGQPSREVRGNCRNYVFHNINYRNGFSAGCTRDDFFPDGRSFDNRFYDNLFITSKPEASFTINGKLCGPEEFKQFNKGAENIIADENIFVDPEHWNFTFKDKVLAKKIGFDFGALRLDWGEFYLPPPRRPANSRKGLLFTPLDLSGVFNRGLVDEEAGDGLGGWSDQGDNDMRGLPTGKQTFDGVPYQLGATNKGAVLFRSERVKADNLPDAFAIPVARKFDEIYFLQTAAWFSAGTAATIRVAYEDGTEKIQHLLYERQLMDWWTDPTWQQHDRLNLNNAYVAWQGKNGSGMRVTIYYLRWLNPEPDRTIARISVSTKDANRKAAFFLLGITGANRPADHSGTGSRSIFKALFDGDVDAIDGTGGTIPASGHNPAAFNAGTFVDAPNGKAFVPRLPLYYAVPDDFPLAGQGSIVMKMRVDRWDSEARIKELREAGFRRMMTPFEALANRDGQGCPWRVTFEIEDVNFKRLFLHAEMCSAAFNADVTDLVKPGEFFELAIGWRPDPKNNRNTLFTASIDGREVFSKSRPGKPDAIGRKLSLGSPANGGQRLIGAIDEVEISR